MLHQPIQSVAIRTPQRVAEVAWFDDLCGGDTQYLSILDSERRSSFAHCADITLAADKLGYSNVLLPTSYTVGQDVLTFAAGIARQTTHTNLLTAIRCGRAASAHAGPRPGVARPHARRAFDRQHHQLRFTRLP